MWWSIVPSTALTIGFLFIPATLVDKLFRVIRYNDKSVQRDTFVPEDYTMSHRDYYIMGSRYVRRGMDFIPEVE